ncbi:hypothetical protein BDB00DRAFT_876680 [Zychaea mexicana]|uniref:uncharacterized protein n=1 Tax=Zychaea mexicana TaxID=64656 RepID=UPI0022FDE852|nr:uncharacterized protein BDB00DRAFT_876680 [Zychaea mexicana]KAI9489204.1 hypothetical protein BDB00DRAFT_876680 [Zychaea mexicana]
MKRPLIAWIEFDNEITGSKLRGRRSHLIEQHSEQGWTAIEVSTRLIKPRPDSTIGALCRKFPLAPAEAVTIHKSQGQTYHSVVVYLPAIALTCYLMYVACSRAVTAERLYLIRTYRRPNPPPADGPLACELSRLETVVLEASFRFLHKRRAYLYQFMFHNIQSIRRHLALVQQDEVYLASDFLLFAETWSSIADNEQDLGIPGFALVTH